MTPHHAVAAGALDVDRYLRRLGLLERPTTDRAGLAALMRAHLVSVPFENLDIVFAGGVPHDPYAAIDKIHAGRGGWCFELNEAFGRLLAALGYEVTRLGAAVLLSGPSVVIEHLTLEVSGGVDDLDPLLVDVGFGDTFTTPLELNTGEVQSDGTHEYQLLPSPQGTTLARIDDGVPAAQFRFKRVAHAFDDFAPIAASMQVDPDKRWHRSPFATRLLGPGDDRVTLAHDHLTLRRGGHTEQRPVGRDAWDDELASWFSMKRPGPWPERAD